MTSRAEGEWWRNVSAEGPPVSLTLRGEPLPATARPVGDPQAVERGLRLFIARFPSKAKPFGVALGRSKLPDEEGPALAARDRGTVIKPRQKQPGIGAE